MSASPTTRLPLTVVIPTYRREHVLVETVHALLRLPDPAAEIILVDQTPEHEPSTDQALQSLERERAIRWLRLSRPSITASMNMGLLMASHPLVLFLDDDIVPEPGLIRAHEEQHRTRGEVIVAGRVLQPWHERGVTFDPNAPFAGTRAQWAREFMGGNFSVARRSAIDAGGFDENFVRVAYRFEAEFAHRWRALGRRIWFEPSACIHHLKAGSGGTRSFGEHLTSWRPDHAVGAYYYSLRTRAWREFTARPLRAVTTRYHLAHPWRIPGTLLAEFGGMAWALRLFLRGPRRVSAPEPSSPA